MEFSSLGQHQLQFFGIGKMSEEGIDRGKREALGKQILKDTRDEQGGVPCLIDFIDAPVFDVDITI